MGSISLRNVSVLSPAPLFRDLTLTIGESDRIGLVAGNGGGKTTLLKCIAGLLEPTEGTVTRSRGLRIGVVEQDVPVNLLDLTFGEAMRRALPPGDRVDNAWRADLMLDAFETPAALRAQTVRTLSGGWQRLALIARTWIAEPDALLLDEPTNHLDLAKIRLLEAWINNADRLVPMVIASHDRAFLDACATRTLFLRPTESRLYGHPYAIARTQLEQDDAAQATKLEKDSREADRLRRSANALRNIGINSRSDAAQKKSMQMARRADALEGTLRPVHFERSGDIRLGNSGTHARVLMALENVTVRAPDGRGLFRVDKLAVRQGDRIVVLGRNGVGKSQLLGLLRQAADTPGSVPGIRVSPSVAPGYVDQRMAQLPGGDTPRRFVGDRFAVDDRRCLSLLAGAGFTMEMQTRPIDRLSPGQKARLGLLALRLAEPNLYLLDEPTNHVDIAGQERLEAEILEHGATCVLVSHDRCFATAIGSRFLLADGGRMTEIASPEPFYQTA